MARRITGSLQRKKDLAGPFPFLFDCRLAARKRWKRLEGPGLWTLRQMASIGNLQGTQVGLDGEPA